MSLATPLTIEEEPHGPTGLGGFDAPVEEVDEVIGKIEAGLETRYLRGPDGRDDLDGSATLIVFSMAWG